MKNKVFRELQLFAAETGTTVSADLAPAISVDFTSRIAQNIVELQQLLGITDLIPMQPERISKSINGPLANWPLR